MTDPLEIAALLVIAQRAIDVEDRVTERREHADMLRSAYRLHKLSTGECDRAQFKRGSPEWEALTAATAIEYADREKAKRAEYNARRRLQIAIKSYRRQSVRSGPAAPSFTARP